MSTSRKSCGLKPLPISAAIATLFAAPLAEAATLTVDTTSDSGGAGCELREAINSVNSAADQGGCVAVGAYGNGDTILIPSLVTGTITLSGTELQIHQDVSIQGPGASHLTVSGNSQSRVLSVAGTSPVLTNARIDGLTISNGTITGATAGGYRYNNFGAGINAYFADLTLTNCIISNNHANNGINPGDTAGAGGISSIFSNLTLNSSTVSGNTSQGSFGGIVAAFGNVSLSNSMISGNTAQESAGGMFSFSTSLTANNSLISENSSSYGGGLAIGYTTASLTNSTLSNNRGDYATGLFSYGSTAIISNCTISGNHGVYGGSIYSYDSDIEFINSTITNNSSQTTEGGLRTYQSSITFSNSILASNTGGDCSILAPSTIQASFSLIGSVGALACGISGGNGNIIGAEPRLGPLANNGCTTPLGTEGSYSCVQTQAPLPGSPAIDTANPNTCRAAPVNGRDERGYSRGLDACDMGAYEVHHQPPNPIPALPAWGLWGLAGFIGGLGSWLQLRRHRSGG